MNLEAPSPSANPRRDLGEIILEVTAAARMAEAIAQASDLVPATVAETAGALGRALKVQADRLARLILPALDTPAATLAVKEDPPEAAAEPTA
jgi:hypothetical protein